MKEKSITDFLIKKYEFNKISASRNKDEIDIDQFTCILRIHIIHYLFYSEIHKHFSIGVRSEHPKKDVTGKYLIWNIIMIPKAIRTFEDAEQVVNLFSDNKFIF